jgi:hypothetical protein
LKLRGILPTALAIASGILVLAGYFFAINVLGEIRLTLIGWAVIVAAFAVFAGTINLTLVHINKVRQREKGMAYSLILVAALILTFLLGLVLGPEDPKVSFIFNTFQLPVETSLMALLAVTLAVAGIRLLRRHLNLLSILFLATSLLVLLGTAPLPFLGSIPFSDSLRSFIAQVFAAGGARGILLGVALGTLTTGLRILFGADRPYGGNHG